ncbi:hypothetical protein V499_09529 [Pseudogymnoascus sp. VKM F-103]|uniref:Cyanovirin-N domain-containing protein n=1 Tax=Pseudogymnoascus verrucosus TaxID=342668 RepID=A0A1B8GAP8_9PEZI|nr:uncharacterized protein VE01_08952 [Pseudogymnoascus verrucosus]KFY70025.1 hypothetical protein V499_09529 [Pseudogymnoascus sp. VKM F-103]OBT92913.1 hypothetical protein VE01_08952 [Pseudogymnoascus verrucosus]
MHLKTCALSVALLSGLASAYVPIGYGQQLQNNDQANHWVVWVEGKSACPNSRTLGLLVKSPCGQKFKYDGVEYKLADCDQSNEPKSLVSGGVSWSCKLDHDKINCHSGTHDIVKHGYCK